MSDWNQFGTAAMLAVVVAIFVVLGMLGLLVWLIVELVG